MVEEVSSTGLLPSTDLPSKSELPPASASAVPSVFSHDLPDDQVASSVEHPAPEDSGSFAGFNLLDVSLATRQEIEQRASIVEPAAPMPPSDFFVDCGSDSEVGA